MIVKRHDEHDCRDSEYPAYPAALRSCLSWSLLSNVGAMRVEIAILRDRASLLAQAREFFALRNILEVDCPILSPFASVDTHIDLIIALPTGDTRYLHSSPEYGMKRLLALGIGDIYQLSHVFRDGDIGLKHNPEFMMAEWYRIGLTFHQMIEETLDFIRLFLGSLPAITLSYRKAMQQYAGFDYTLISPEELIHFLEEHHIYIDDSIDKGNKDTLLNLVLGSMVEPFLGKNQLCALTHYPASQSALARIVQREDEEVSERFEVYYKGIELANGYHELTDAVEQRARFEHSNRERVELKKAPLPIDEAFLAALKMGLPDCCGVAVGFDRLMMLRHGVSSISSVIPFDWNNS